MGLKPFDKLQHFKTSESAKSALTLG